MSSFLASKRWTFFILAVTAVALSRAMFSFFDDPEGPNLLIVAFAAALVYGASLAAYLFPRGAASALRFWVAIAIQALAAAVLSILGVTL